MGKGVLKANVLNGKHEFTKTGISKRMRVKPKSLHKRGMDIFWVNLPPLSQLSIFNYFTFGTVQQFHCQ